MTKKAIFLAIVLSLIINLSAQNINGKYSSLLLNTLEIDTSGHIRFYGIDSFSTQKHFHEVEIKIHGKKISVRKSPVYFENDQKVYSVSDGGFLYYTGTLMTAGDVLIAKLNLVNCEYYGFSIFKVPKLIGESPDPPDSVVRANSSLYDKFTTKDGEDIYIPKGVKSQDIILRPDKGGIWVNNIFFRKTR